MKNVVKQIISQLKAGTIKLADIPKEYQANVSVIKAERSLKMRHIIRCGYDVISNKFFVEEEYDEQTLLRNRIPGRFFSSYIPVETFDDFQSFYNYTGGKIYENSCFYQLNPETLPEKVNKDRLFLYSSFIDLEQKPKIMDYGLYAENDVIPTQKEREKNKKQVIKWIERFNQCLDYGQLKKTVQNYSRTTLSNTLDVTFFFWRYILYNRNDEQHFNTIMSFVANGDYPSYKLLYPLCYIFDAEKVITNYRERVSGSDRTDKQNLQGMMRIAKEIQNDELVIKKNKYFDSQASCYCVETSAYGKEYNMKLFDYREDFDGIEDFLKNVEYDLRNCDLSGSYDLEYDLSSCIIDSSTILPIKPNEEYVYSVKKRFIDGRYYVFQRWQNKSGATVKQYKHSFKYFCDFVAFLNGDLSNADLISCDGLDNLVSIEGISFENALLRKQVSVKFGLPYQKYVMSFPETISFDYSEQNEIKTLPVLQANRDISVADGRPFLDYKSPNRRIHYVSDIHLNHMLKNSRTDDRAEMIAVVRDVANNIIQESESNGIVLINGDTSFDFELFTIFIKELSIMKNQRVIIFTIGNHETWSFPNDNIDQLVEKYRTVLQTRRMFLLQNSIIFFENYSLPEIISESEINALSENELKNKVRKARLILFGGMGFAGYDESFNATNGLYRHNNILGFSREAELIETNRFEALYNKVCSALDGRNVVVMTHMPIYGWLRKDNDALGHDKDLINDVEMSYANPEIIAMHKPGFIYTSGHTHQNFFFDDGDVRIYNDNQFGYYNHGLSSRPHLKFFEVEKTYDIFYDYTDGIYSISADEYRLFYRGKNIQLTYNKDHNELFMLKKNGYYMFILRSAKNQLHLLNAGQFVGKLSNPELKFYYDSMEKVIDYLRDPLDQYTSIQNQIAEEVKQFGGYGTIHGCIVDIDFYNHIFLNPVDGKITGYWASDIINKEIYPSVESLLKANCPQLYVKYKQLLTNKTSKKLSIIPVAKASISASPISYTSTDIYKMSRQMKRMQKLQSNILTIWPAEYDCKAVGAAKNAKEEKIALQPKRIEATSLTKKKK